MRVEIRNVTCAASLLAFGATGLAVNVTSVAGWTALVGLALLPTVFMVHLWSDPAQSLSESIQEARR